MATQSQDGPVKPRVTKVVKTKPVKRKAVEALDLSMKPSPDKVTGSTAKRIKVTAANEPQPTPSGSGCVATPTAAWPRLASEKDEQSNKALASPAAPQKLKKTRKTNKKSLPSPETEAHSEVDRSRSLPTEVSRAAVPAQQASDQQTAPSVPGGGRSSAGAQLGLLTKQKASSEKDSRAPESDKPQQGARAGCSSGKETPSPVEDQPPTFRRPQGKPISPRLELPAPRNKRSDTAEEDEGIHSHDGGSDISDSASEGSDDSGLNGLAARAGKAADPETPTDEVPTPAELKSHLCIFCDRAFLQEVDYRRHLNRHLVNVYYLDGHLATKGPLK